MDDEVLVWVTRGGAYHVWPRGFFQHSGKPTRLKAGPYREFIVAVRGSMDNPRAAKVEAYVELRRAGFDVPPPELGRD